MTEVYRKKQSSSSLPPSNPLLALSSAFLNSPSSSTNSTRQSSQTRIQSQTRICCIPSSCPTWRPKTPRPKRATYGKPVNQGVNQLKFARSLQSVAEERAGRQCGALRVLNSYWVAQDSTYKYFKVIMVDPMHKAIRRDTEIQWICKSVMKHRENRGLTSAGRKSRGLGKGHKFSHTIGGSVHAAWKRRNTTQMHRKR